MRLDEILPGPAEQAVLDEIATHDEDCDCDLCSIAYDIVHGDDGD